MPHKDIEQRREYQRQYYRQRRKEARRIKATGKTAAEATGRAAAEAIAAWAADTLIVPTGLLQGQPFTLQPWQIDWLAAALGEGVTEAALSVARKNGKTALVAAVCLSYLAGPMTRSRWRAVAVSLTAALATELLLQLRELNDAAGLGCRFKLAPTPHVFGANDTRLDVLAAEKSSGHAVGCDLAIVDELGLLPESKRHLVEAVLNSTRGRNGRLLAISIRGFSPLFTEIEQRASANVPGVVWREYAAAPGARLDDPAAWRAANPAMGSVNSEEALSRLAARAVATPSVQGEFRAQCLNQRAHPDETPIVTVADWQACECADGDLPPRQGPCFVALDLGGSTSMTAAAAYWPTTHRLEAWAALPDSPNLRDRGLADGVGDLYMRMRGEGELRTYRGRTVPHGTFIADARARLAGCDIRRVSGDRFKLAEAQQAILDAGIPWRYEARATGAHRLSDGSRDIRSFERAVIERRVRSRRGVLMPAAIAESRITYDPQGNPRLDKQRSKGRIDAVSAAVIAVGTATDAASASVQIFGLGDGE